MSTNTLPSNFVASHEVIQRLPDHYWAEGLAFAHDGTLYTGATTGMDWSTGDSSRAIGAIFKRDRDGTQSTYFSFPVGTVAGVPAIGSDGTVYITATGEGNGIWRITGEGHGERIAELIHPAWPNGLTFGPNGFLYAADSTVGKIWRIDPATGSLSVALHHTMLESRIMPGIVPGANGIHFHGGDAFITVSERGTIVRARLGDDGTLGEPVIFVSDIPSDDFAIGSDGTLYVTTHVANTVVRVKPDGTKTVIADARHGVTGSTDAALGVTPDDEAVLYVSTDDGFIAVSDDGAIGGNATPNGTVVALRL